MIVHSSEAPYRHREIVILGGSGFVGKSLTQSLKQLSYKVTSLSSKECDLLCEKSIQSLDRILSNQSTLIFAAALTPEYGRDFPTFMKNLRMLEMLQNVLTRSKCEHIIYISSDAVYGSSSGPFTEESPCAPLDYYGLMHLTRERLLQQISKESSIPLCIVRPVALFGSGDTHNSYGPNRFIRTAQEEQKILLFGKGEEKRDHLFIEDLSLIVREIAKHGSYGVLTAATGNSITFFELAQLVSDLFPGTEIHFSDRRSPITHIHYDNSALIEAFPELQLTPLSEGLKRSFMDA